LPLDDSFQIRGNGRNPSLGHRAERSQTGFLSSLNTRVFAIHWDVRNGGRRRISTLESQGGIALKNRGIIETRVPKNQPKKLTTTR
jgi:hypothetical protein